MVFVQNQIVELRKNYNVIVIANELKNEHLFEENVLLTPLSFCDKIYNKSLRLFGIKYSSNNRIFRIKLRKLYVENNIIGAICHFGPAGLQVGEILTEFGIKYSVIIHGFDGSTLLKDKRYVKQISHLKEAKFVFVAESLKRNFNKIISQDYRSRTIHLGININSLLVSSADRSKRTHEDLIFFQASNFVEKKGHIFTIHAFSEYLKFKTNSILYLAGDGPLKNYMQEEVCRLGLEKNVIFLGHKPVSFIYNFFSQVDVFVHHSITAQNGDQEGLPTVIMEAMYYQLPVISTFHSGIPELIKHGYNGFLVNEGDILSYTNAMLEISDSCEFLGKNARRTIIENFDISTNVHKIVEFTTSDTLK
jgi:colanic acid/amylovoran biosynthesis glycosyltransferase